MSPETAELSLRNPELSFRNLAPGVHYGLGWFVSPSRSGQPVWGHAGSMPGVVTQLSVNARNVTWAWMFNASVRDEQAFVDLVNGALLSATQTLTDWPTHNLSGSFDTPSAHRPELDQAGILNAASFQQGVSPGSWITLFGKRLSGNSRSWSTGDFRGSYLPTTLDGVRVIANGRPAPIAYISENQINALLPFSHEPEVWVQAIRDGLASEPLLLPVPPRAPAVFTYRAGTLGFAAALHPDGTLVGDPILTPSARPAQSGDHLSLFATGLSAFPVETTLSRPLPLDQPVVVLVANTPAHVEFAGLTTPGLEQVNFIVPSLPAGNHPIKIVIENVESRQTVWLPIR